jgi:hypothetical protein
VSQRVKVMDSDLILLMVMDNHYLVELELGMIGRVK